MRVNDRVLVKTPGLLESVDPRLEEVDFRLPKNPGFDNGGASVDPRRAKKPALDSGGASEPLRGPKKPPP